MSKSISDQSGVSIADVHLELDLTSAPEARSRSGSVISTSSDLITSSVQKDNRVLKVSRYVFEQISEGGNLATILRTRLRSNAGDRRVIQELDLSNNSQRELGGEFVAIKGFNEGSSQKFEDCFKLAKKIIDGLNHIPGSSDKTFSTIKKPIREYAAEIEELKKLSESSFQKKVANGSAEGNPQELLELLGKEILRSSSELFNELARLNPVEFGKLLGGLGLITKEEGEERGANSFFHYFLERSHALGLKFSVVSNPRPETKQFSLDAVDGELSALQKDHVTTYSLMIESVMNSIPLLARSRDLSSYVENVMKLLVADLSPLDRNTTLRTSDFEIKSSAAVDGGAPKEGGNLKKFLKIYNTRNAGEQICQMGDDALRKMNTQDWTSFIQGGKASAEESKAIDDLRNLNKISGISRGVKKVSDLMERISSTTNPVEENTTRRVRNLQRVKSSLEDHLPKGGGKDETLDCEQVTKDLSRYLGELFDLDYGFLKETSRVQAYAEGEDRNKFMIDVVGEMIERHFKIFGVMAADILTEISESKGDKSVFNEVVVNFLDKFFDQIQLGKMDKTNKKIPVLGCHFRELFSSQKAETLGITSIRPSEDGEITAPENIFNFNRDLLIKRLESCLSNQVDQAVKLREYYLLEKNSEIEKKSNRDQKASPYITPAKAPRLISDSPGSVATSLSPQVGASSIFDTKGWVKG